MSDARHEPFEGMAALYALGALTATEREGVESHLELCLDCVREVRSLISVTHGLAHVAPPLDATPALRTRVLEQITGTVPPPSDTSTTDTTGLDSPGPALDSPDDDRRDTEPARTGPGALFWLAAVLVVAAAGGGGWYVAELDRQIVALEDNLATATAETARLHVDAAAASAVAAERDAVLAIVTSASAQQLTLVGQPLAPRATARAVWTDAAEMVFLASGLPPLPAGDVYQLWFVRPDAPVSAALLDPDDDGRATVIIDVPDAMLLPTTMAITVEPTGGVPAPTGDVYLLGQPAG